MIKTLEKSGRTEEDALNAALRELGCDRDDVSVEIVERAKSGFLGIGAVQAVIRVSYEAPDEPQAPAAKVPEAEKPAPAARPRPGSAPAAKAAEKAEKCSSQDAEAVKTFIAGLFEHMGIEAQLNLTDRDDGGINVDVCGPGMGAIIGRRGETLDAIQHLANYAVNRGSEKHVHISVDAENYRAKREDSLAHLAEKMAAKVIKYKRSMALEPMNSYERHVIHTALQDYPGVSTGSTGTEPNRRVVISYERGDAPRQGQNRRNSDSRRPAQPRPAQTTAPAPAPAPAADSAAETKSTDTGSKKPQSREWA